MKIYGLEIRIKDRFAAKDEEEAKKEMVRRIKIVVEGDIFWRLMITDTTDVYEGIIYV